MHCEYCGSHNLEFLGLLGNVDHFRCRDCGMDHSEEMQEDEEPVDDDSYYEYDDDGQPDEMQEWHDFDPDC